MRAKTKLGDNAVGVLLDLLTIAVILERVIEYPAVRAAIVVAEPATG
jgi:hypothetical protein